MRSPFTFALFALPLALMTLSGCRVSISEIGDDADDGSATPAPPAAPAPSSSSSSSHTTLGQPTTSPAAVADAPFNEVVYVLMKDRLARTWFCTGTLVAKTTVVTAGHCLGTEFLSYEVIAPRAANAPRVAASRLAAFEGDYEDPAVADIGFLTLAKPIDLPAYAVLTDVSAQLDAGDVVSAQASVRTKEQPQAPLASTQILTVNATAELGYAHGISTPLFSNGGDSGAGLFLVENGVATHKLIGIARQPDPARSLDHFTRIDGDVAAWCTEKTAR